MTARTSHSALGACAVRPSLKRRRLDRSWSIPSRPIVCRQSNQDDEAPPSAPNKLAAIIRRKQQELSVRLKELGDEGLEERLQSATQSPARPAHRLTQLVADTAPTGRPVLVFELSRGGVGASTSEELGGLATKLVAAGADALAVKTDAEATPEPLKDLLAVTQAATAAAKRRSAAGGAFTAAAQAPPPVLQRDWFIHPLQIAEAKEAGAAGVLGTIASVNSRGTPIMSSFASAIGLDCPVEIVNMQELKALEPFQLPFFAMNLSVALSVSVAGFGLQVATGLLGELPFGSVSLVGAKSVEEARRAREAGADCVLVKAELLHQFVPDRLDRLVEQLRDATCGDD